MSELITNREMEIIKLYADGYNRESIGHQLNISEETVQKHASSVYRKLGINESRELVVWYYKTFWEPKKIQEILEQSIYEKVIIYMSQQIYGTTRECFACEQVFRPIEALSKNVPLDFCESYCSNECYQQFQEELKSSIEQAKAAGLVDAEGNAILQTNTTPAAVRTVLQNLGVKLKSDG